MDVDKLIQETLFKAIRSSGSGGQHANKVSTKVELQFNIQDSLILTEEEKQRLLKSIAHRLTKENVLILQCDDTRSQLQNKEKVVQRFKDIITKGLKKPKKRIPTKTPSSVKRKRSEDKKRLSQKKASRKKPDLD